MAASNSRIVPARYSCNPGSVIGSNNLVRKVIRTRSEKSPALSQLLNTNKYATHCGLQILNRCLQPFLESHSNGAESDQSVTEVIIVRHGETEWNALRKMQGQADIDLNDLGRQQANAVGERLSREAKISAVYTSDLKRALDTANIIATKCGGIQVITDQDLREMHFGVLEGQIYNPEELKKLHPQAYKALMSHDQEIPGGGESRNQLYKRGTEAVQRIGDKHKGERVVVVTHRALIDSLEKRACLGVRTGGMRNASIGVIVLSDGGVWSVKTWDDIGHLGQTSILESLL